jgi:8-oxo-dGTP diphosphatase
MQYKQIPRSHLPRNYTGEVLVPTSVNTSHSGKLMNVTPFPIPSLTATVAIFHEHQVLLGLRKQDPFQGQWCLPGGFLNPGEAPVDAALREVREETGITLTNKDLMAVGERWSLGADPRGWVVDFSFTVQIDSAGTDAGDDIEETRWFSIHDLPSLAFDHDKIVRHAIAIAQLIDLPESGYFVKRSDRPMFAERLTIADEEATLESRNGEVQHGKPGDYKATGVRGEHWFIDSEIFKETYTFPPAKF